MATHRPSGETSTESQVPSSVTKSISLVSPLAWVTSHSSFSWAHPTWGMAGKETRTKRDAISPDTVWETERIGREVA
jgi:hypothetical protein